jgi:hypothetical protein
MNPALVTPTEAQQAVGTATTSEVSVSAEFAQEIIDRIQATDAFRVESVTGGQAPVERVNLGGITSPNQFWLRIAIPNRADFRTQQSARTAFNLAQSLWAVTEWVWNNWQGPDIRPATKQAYWDDLYVRCPNILYVQDIAEAAKHCHLHRPTVQTASVNEETLEITLKDGTVLQMDDVFESAFAAMPSALKFR